MSEMSARSRRPMRSGSPFLVASGMELSNFFAHTMLRTAHSGSGVGRHDLADDEPVEEPSEAARCSLTVGLDATLANCSMGSDGIQLDVTKC